MRSLSVSQVSDFCGVSAGTVRRWADTGILRAHRLPSGYRRFDERDVLLLKQRIEANGKAHVATWGEDQVHCINIGVMCSKMIAKCAEA